MALVPAAYARLFSRLWKEMPMEHVCVVKWALPEELLYFLISLQEQGDTLAPGIQTMSSRLICATMFCLLWRLVMSQNLWIAMSLPVSTVCTSISARPFYSKISKRVVAYALGSVYLLCTRTRGWSSYQSCLENPDLVLLKYDKKLLPLHLYDIQWENLAAIMDQCLVLSDYLQG